jgi:UDP-N-acetylglucosamine--N-acetylmuramyl-(pentapeptide) pyrophosphoryl-undecaprenol N-acetylglucosamine transferase
MGGFASGPGGIAAWLLRRPLLIHEQNAVAGLTNRLLAGFAREVLQAFPGSFSARIRARTVGNPVRPEIAGLPAPGQRMARRTGPARLLVLGGSQGALYLNRIVPLALARLDGVPTEVRHQAGTATLEQARQAYEDAGIGAEIVPFFDDMAECYGWADIVICRAGALTISELAAAGLGAILVPLPTAVDDHQTHNAQFLVDAGAATILQESDLDADRLAKVLADRIADRDELLDRATQARQLAKPEATDVLVARCLEWARP